MNTHSHDLIEARPATVRRYRGGLVWVYVLSLIGACAANSVRNWNLEQIENAAQWGLVFLTPALLMWFLQSVRRRLAMIDGGDLIEAFPAQRTGNVPGWLMGMLFFLAAVFPLTLFAIHDSDAFVVMVVAFLGVMLFCMAWLWFDGIPVEVRTNGLVVDGIHLLRYRDLEQWQPVRRSNVVELHHQGRLSNVYVCPNDRPRLLELLDDHVANAESQLTDFD